MDRRQVLRGMAALATIGMAKNSNALPILSANNYGLTYEKAIQMNCWAEINTKHFEGNLQRLKNMLGATKLCVVIKANAYGHGLDLLMPTILNNGVDILGFTSNEEARIARGLGFRGKLIRLREATYDEMYDAASSGYNVEEMIGSNAAGFSLYQIARYQRKRINAHLMLNSGRMGRNGLDLTTSTAARDAILITTRQYIDIVGVCTHFPNENNSDVVSGLANFDADCKWLFANTPLNRRNVILHAANSYATLNVSAARLDMVRCGAALYDNSYGLNQVMTMKSKVASVHRLSKGQPISYDGTYLLDRNSYLANIPVGYSDGFQRAFSYGNRPPDPSKPRPYILISNAASPQAYRCPVVGRVTMNTLLVDITDANEDLKGVLNAGGDGDVVLLGQLKNESISWSDWVRWSGTGTYDLATELGNSLPKVIAP